MTATFTAFPPGNPTPWLMYSSTVLSPSPQRRMAQYSTWCM